MADEQRGFVFAVTFIMIFSVLLATIPLGLQGPANDPDMISPVNPNLLSGFSESKSYTRDNFTADRYDYTLAGREWIAGSVAFATIAGFALSAKALLFGVIWLGVVEEVKFISSAGIDRGLRLQFSEIGADAAIDGTVSYSLQFDKEGTSAGSFVIYWNTTTYADPEDSWDNDGLFIIHGFGIEQIAAINIGALLIQLLFLQIPDVPLLVNFLLVVPIWASIIYIIWYIVKEMIPFV